MILNLFDIPVINIKNTINYLLSINSDFIIIISKNKVHTKEVNLYENFCKYFGIDYKIFYSDEIYNFNKNIIDNIFISVQEKKSLDLIENNSLFRIIEFYDIPDRNYIVAGIQLNNIINVGDELYIVNNNDISKIKIKSIHKKNINYKLINQNETGSINFDFIDNKKFKINKNSYITNKINKKISELHLIDDLKINLTSNSTSNSTILCSIYNGNNNYKLQCEIKNNVIKCKPIILTDKRIILDINNTIYFTKIK
jgi:hypothetical protein